MNQPCPFCTAFAPERVLFASEHALAITDRHPVSPGHALVLPRRHTPSLFATTGDERAALFRLLDDTKRLLDSRHAPQAYNIGINDGAAAGQTVPHLHIHLIPRYTGDRPDPRGGVRWVLPERAAYWTRTPLNGEPAWNATSPSMPSA